MNSQETGWLGELRAAAYIRRHGMRVIAQRYRFGHAEIDLIAREGGTLAFIEVKARPKGHLGDGVLAVGKEKQRHLRAAAQAYLNAHPWPGPVRFDVIEISAAGLRHIKNAF